MELHESTIILALDMNPSSSIRITRTLEISEVTQDDFSRLLCSPKRCQKNVPFAPGKVVGLLVVVVEAMVGFVKDNVVLCSSPCPARTFIVSLDPTVTAQSLSRSSFVAVAVAPPFL